MLAELDHRPWALPNRPWVWAMKWLDSLFIHWPVDIESLRRHVPAALEIDTFDGQAWVTILPFQMAGSRLRYTPPLPWLSNFLELNVRTYVKADGKGGVWVLSVEVSNPVVVHGTRFFYDMPFYQANMSLKEIDTAMHYGSQRLYHDGLPAEFSATCQPSGAIIYAEKGSLDHWLTERYCAYATNRKGEVLRSEIHHAQWSLQPVEVEIQTNTLLDALDLNVSPTAPRFHYSPGVEVVAWVPNSLKNEQAEFDI